VSRWKRKVSFFINHIQFGTNLTFDGMQSHLSQNAQTIATITAIVMSVVVSAILGTRVIPALKQRVAQMTAAIKALVTMVHVLVTLVRQTPPFF
jgi:hypothetical protein